MIFDGRAPRLWLRLEQHGDKPFYARLPSDLVDGFILNANLIESSPEACASFLDHARKPFLIDPMSYRFERVAWYTRDKDGDEVGKRNYVRLWQKYSRGVAGLSGDPLTDRGSSRLSEDTDIARFCQNVIDFQELRLRTAWIEDGAQYVGMEAMFGGQLAPIAYMAPYQVIGEGNIDEEARLAVALAKTAAAIANPRPVVAVLPLLGKALRNADCLRSLATDIGTSGVQEVLVWAVGEPTLLLADDPALFTGLTILSRSLRDAGLEVGMLYGGILSSLLRGHGVAGFSHGLMYGEVRGLEPSRGLPATAFYFPPLRQPLRYDFVAQLIAQMSADEYLEKICSCAVCTQLIGRDVANLAPYFETYLPEGAKRPLPTQEALGLNRFHYLLARGDELALARSMSEPSLIAEFLDAAEGYPANASRTVRSWVSRLRTA
jgi:hypothetical protein